MARPSRISETAPSAAIELRGVELSLGGSAVLEQIDLTVPRGDFLGLIGPNGGGKTMLLKILAGLVRPDAGEVTVLGLPPSEARGRIGLVPQTPVFDRNFPIRVIDVVLMGRLGQARLLRGFAAEDRRRADEALYQVGLSKLAGRQIGRLSGGQLQRVLIARALAMDAELLMLDEPTSALDAGTAGQLLGLLGELAGEHTVVLVAHDVGMIYRHVRNVACLNRRLHQHPVQELTRERLERLYGYPLGVVTHDPRGS